MRQGRTGILRIGISMVFTVLALTGCSGEEQSVITVFRPSYQRMSYQTVEARRGDLGASLSLNLVAEGYREIVYNAPMDELILDEVHVSVGDRVKKGDVLVSFESERIRQIIEQYEDEKSRKELLIQHYEELMRIGGNTDYETDVSMLREDIRVAQIYIDEAGELLMEYQIVAKADGIITEISEFLQNNVIEPEVELVRQVAGTGCYLATATDTEFFAPEETYPVSADGIVYDLRLVEVGDNMLTFEPVGGGLSGEP